MLKAYLDFWKKYGNTTTRTNRKDFWLAFLANTILTVIISVVAFLAIGGMVGPIVVISLWVFITLIPWFTAASRRLLDAGENPITVLLILVPGIGFLLLFAKLAKPSTDKPVEVKMPVVPVKPAAFSSGPVVRPMGASGIRTNTGAGASSGGDSQNLVKYVGLVDKYAHYCSLVINDPEPEKMEKEIVVGGKDALTAISEYLMSCAYGKVSQGWWDGAAGLTRMLRKIDKTEGLKHLTILTTVNTNIYEYQTQVKNIAERELLAAEKERGNYPPDGKIPEKYAHAEILELELVSPMEKRLEQCFGMLDSVDGWSKKNQAFFYYTAARAVEKVYPESKAVVAFSAAQVNVDPDPGSLGWDSLKRVEGDAFEKTAEFAKKMHEKYPVPKSMQEAETYPG